MTDCLDKIRELKKIKDEKGYSYEIEIDGGVSLDNIKEVMETGVDVVVAGSAVSEPRILEKLLKICWRLSGSLIKNESGNIC